MLYTECNILKNEAHLWPLAVYLWVNVLFVTSFATSDHSDAVKLHFCSVSLPYQQKTELGCCLAKMLNRFLLWAWASRIISTIIKCLYYSPSGYRWHFYYHGVPGSFVQLRSGRVTHHNKKTGNILSQQLIINKTYLISWFCLSKRTKGYQPFDNLLGCENTFKF